VSINVEFDSKLVKRLQNEKVIEKSANFSAEITFLAIFHTHIEYFVVFKSELFAH
jgi:hypothetical protein